MGAGAIAAREGVYTTWAIQARYDTGVALSNNDSLGIRNNGEVYYHDQSAYTAYIISSAAALLATLNTHLAVSGYSQMASLADGYLILPKWNDGDTNIDKIVVLKGIVELWDRDVNDDEAPYTLEPAGPGPVDPGLLAISPSGEWIAVIVKEDATGFGLIFIYKGSP
ncbi:hypothetical protein ES703_23075 [subsurface metagenome]